MTGAPGQSLGNSHNPSPWATHQLLRCCVLDESRAVARLPGAGDPHPWERQEEGGVFRMEQFGKATSPKMGPWPSPSFQTPQAGLCPPQNAQGRAGFCPQLGPPLKLRKETPG